jgi:hypothetical protein
VIYGVGSVNVWEIINGLDKTAKHLVSFAPYSWAFAAIYLRLLVSLAYLLGPSVAHEVLLLDSWTFLIL